MGGRITALAIDPFDADRVLIGGDLLGIAVSTDGGSTWERTTGLLSHEVARFTFHPEREGEVWAGTLSGPHVSFDGGMSWEPRRAGMPEVSPNFYTAPIELVLVDAAQPGRLLAVGGSHREWPDLDRGNADPALGAVWESLDDGVTWSLLSQIAEGANVVAAVWLDDGTLLAAALDSGVWRSDDRGASWFRSSEGLVHWNVRDLAVANDTTVYATLAEGLLIGENYQAGGVWRSDDAGATWFLASGDLPLRESTQPLQTSRFDAVVVSPVDPDTLWTAELAFGLEQVWRSEDGGQSWQIELPGDADIDRAYLSKVTAEVLVADPSSPELRFLAQAEYVLRRNDGGDWQDVSSTRVNGNWAGTGYSGLVSTDIFVSTEQPGTVLLAGLDGAHLVRSRDGGVSWDRPLLDWYFWGGSQSIAVGGRGDSHQYVLLGQFFDFNGIASTIDGGETWRFAAGAEAGLPQRVGQFAPVEYMDDVAVSAADPTVVAATIAGDIYLSVDAGLNWALVQVGLNNGFGDGFRSLVADTAGGFYVGDLNNVYQLSADGLTLTAIEGSPGRTESLTVDPTTGALYAVRLGVNDLVDGTGYIGRWTLAGWEQLCLDPNECGTGLDEYAAHVAVHPDDPNRLLVSTNDLPFHDVMGSSGVYESVDGGASWTQLGDGLTIDRVTVAKYDPNLEGRVIVGTMGGGFFELPGLPFD